MEKENDWKEEYDRAEQIAENDVEARRIADMRAEKKVLEREYSDRC